MRFVKGISLFLLYPLLMLTVGFFAGVKAVQFFYPGDIKTEQKGSVEWVDFLEAQMSESAYDLQIDELVLSAEGEGTMPVASTGEKLSADTEYVLEETDLVRHTVVETTWRLPPKYVGMNREQFLEAMETYGNYPPLSELERGFVGLEVLSFSRERVVVQMNYEYLQPSEGFYLAVQDNEVIVYLEDLETVYINTGILLEQLPEDVQMEIIQMMWMEDQATLYDFLETYSS